MGTFVFYHNIFPYREEGKSKLHLCDAEMIGFIIVFVGRAKIAPGFNPVKMNNANPP